MQKQRNNFRIKNKHAVKSAGSSTEGQLFKLDVREGTGRTRVDSTPYNRGEQRKLSTSIDDFPRTFYTVTLTNRAMYHEVG